MTTRGERTLATRWLVTDLGAAAARAGAALLTPVHLLQVRSLVITPTNETCFRHLNQAHVRVNITS